MQFVHLQRCKQLVCLRFLFKIYISTQLILAHIHTVDNKDLSNFELGINE